MPYWVRVRRMGTTFTSYVSANGTTWTTVGSQTISMTGTVFVGLAVTATNNSLLSKAVFDNVSITSSIPPPGRGGGPGLPGGFGGGGLNGGGPGGLFRLGQRPRTPVVVAGHGHEHEHGHTARASRADRLFAGTLIRRPGARLQVFEAHDHPSALTTTNPECHQLDASDPHGQEHNPRTGLEPFSGADLS